MRNLIRSPLVWMVVVEFIIVGVLAVVAWNVVASAIRPSFASPMTLPGDSGGASPSPLPDLPATGPGSPRGPLPGLNVDSGFWRQRLAQLNREQALLAQLEWRIVHSAMDAARHYVQTVVLPAVQRAEHAGSQALS
jgi:hypothetical protein